MLSSPSKSSRRLYWISASLIFVALLCIYVPGLHNKLIFDDARLTDGSIFENYASAFKLQPRWLSYGTFAWLQPVLGDGYVGQRIFNLLLHVATCGALFLFLNELFRVVAPAQSDDGSQRTRDEVAVIASVGLFAVHPMAVYGVAYLVQRSIVMATLFSILACYCFVRALRRPQPLWLLGALLAYIAALLSKEQAVLVAALAVPFYVFIQRPAWRRVLLVAGASVLMLGGVAYLLTLRYGSIVGATAFDETSQAYLRQLDALKPGVSALAYPLSIVNQALLYFKYGLLWLIPNPRWMAIDLRPPFPLSFLDFPQSLGAVAFLALALGGCWLVLTRRDRWGLAGLFVVCAALLFSTEFATTWVQDPFVLYRTYLWAFPLVGLVALGLAAFRPRTIAIVGVVLGCVFSALAWERVQSLRDDVTAWGDAAAKVDLDAAANAVGRWRPFINRGAYYLEREQADYALRDFETAVRLGEPLGSAQVNRAVALQLLKRHAEALQALDAAEQAGFNEQALYYHRAISLAQAGRLKEAVQSYAVALEKPQADRTLRQTLLEQAEVALAAQDYGLAIKNYGALLTAQPSEERYRVGMGIAKAGHGDSAEALGIFNELLKERASAPALYGRAVTYISIGNRAAALEDIDQAVKLDPRNPAYRRIQQSLMVEAGKPQKAAAPRPPPAR